MRKILICFITAFIMLSSILFTGCESNIDPVQTEITPEAFLAQYDLKVQPNPQKFKVDVPAKWEVKSGDYPVGLYWSLANEFSKDAGLDLAHFKGINVEVWRYALADGLPGQGDQSKFSYPSDLIMLVDAQKVVGAWLTFNKSVIGPSIKRHYLKDISGLTYEEWVEKQGLFSDMGKNKDLAGLDSVELLNAFFKAITDGDKKRAYSCQDPYDLLNSLTMNLGENCLYNPGFSLNNSIVDNIIKAEPISYKLADTRDGYKEIEQVTDQKELAVSINLNIQWQDSQFNNPGGSDIRFTTVRKYKNGWKLLGLGTGP